MVGWVGRGVRGSGGGDVNERRPSRAAEARRTAKFAVPGCPQPAHGAALASLPRRLLPAGCPRGRPRRGVGSRPRGGGAGRGGLGASGQVATVPRDPPGSRSWTGLGQAQQLPRRRCRPRSGRSPSAMLTVRRERPLGLGVCECVYVCVLAKSSLRGDSAAWALRPAARGLPLRCRRRRRPPHSRFRSRSGLRARLPRSRQARPAFSEERSSVSPCRWEPGLRLPPHAAIPTRPPPWFPPLPPPPPSARPPPSLSAAASPPPAGAALGRQPPARRRLQLSQV